jgi:hypothetical protein
VIALSIRQPWAWAIFNAGKDIENRDWVTEYRGRVLIHVGLTMTRAEYDAGIESIHAVVPAIVAPAADMLPRGGIVGSVEIVDCVSSSASPWFVGEFGFVLRDPQPMPFTPYKGRLQFFNVPAEVVEAGT